MKAVGDVATFSGMASPTAELAVAAMSLGVPVGDDDFPWTAESLFIIRSAPIDRLEALFELLRARGRCRELHVLSHARDEAQIRELAPVRNLVFHSYPSFERYREDELQSLLGEVEERGT